MLRLRLRTHFLSWRNQVVPDIMPRKHNTCYFFLAVIFGACLQYIFQKYFITLFSHPSLSSTLPYLYEHYNEREGFHHWFEFGDYYEKHLHTFKDKSVVHMLEIGVQSGGSSRIWRQYFGGKLQYTGVDINPACAQFADLSAGIRIEIGSQLNTSFLDHVCRTHRGPFDVIIDDGGHTTEMMLTSLRTLWPCLAPGGVYAIEDTLTMSSWRGQGGMLVEGMDLFGHIADLTRRQVAYYAPEIVGKPMQFTAPDEFAQHLAAIHVYDNMVFFQKRVDPWKPLTEFKRGSQFIAYS